MPRIDINDMKAGFKKKEYRAWDNNLLETLKIPKNQDEEESSSEKESQIAESATIVQKKTTTELELNQGSIGVQLESNKGSVTVHSESNKSSIAVQSGRNQGSIGAQVEEPNKVHLEFNYHSETENYIRKLGGNEQKIFFYIIEICIAKESLSTGEIPGKTIMSSIGTTKNGMETALKRLRKKNLISREKGKTGKNGLINLTVSEATKNEAIKYMHTSKFDQEILRDRGSFGVQFNRASKVQLESRSSLYSSNNIKNTTTVLPEEWKKINFYPLESIGFSEQHLLDIYQTHSNDPKVVQESIYHFAFGLEEGRHKSYDSPLKVFIGRLRKGNSWIESNYESPKEKALRELLSRRKAEKEKYDAMIKELVDIEFPDWRKKLTQDEIKKIVPQETLKTNLAPAVTAALRTYYIENIILPKLEMNEKV